MFPVSSPSVAASASEASSEKLQRSTALISPASLQRLKMMKNAEERQQSLTASSDVFTPLSKGAEEFSGNMFKVGMFMISIPLAGERVRVRA